jgi:phage gp46-like protein
VSDFRTLVIPGPEGQLPRMDLAIDGYQLAVDDGLETALIHSLFTDARAQPDDVLPDPQDNDPRGWVGDTYAEVPNDAYGSRLWLLSRERQIPDTLKRVKQYAEEATAWLVQDGVADRVDIEAEFPQMDWLALGVTVYRGADAPRRYQFLKFWGTP